LNINRQSFLIRNNRSTSSPLPDNDTPVNDDNDNDEDDEENTPTENEEESDEEEMNRSITNTVERIRELRESMTSIRERQRASLSDEAIDTRTQNNFMCTQIGCWQVFQLCFVLSLWHIVVISTLHNTYISNTYRRSSSCIDYALRTRGDRSRFVNGTNATVGNMTLPLLGSDEILQIKILYGGKCTGQCSRVHTIIQPNSTNTTNNTEPIIPSNNSWVYNRNINSNQFTTASYWEDVQYRFSSSEALLYVENDILYDYNISLVNVTLTERCLSTGSDHGEYKSVWNYIGQLLSPIYDMDTPIVNLLCLGLSSSSISTKGDDDKALYGYLQNVHTLQHWSWKHKKASSTTANKELLFVWKAISWIMHKFSSFLLSIITFFLITSITSLVVRVLTSSGVVLMYPLFALFHYFHIPHMADERILSLSYPWIGRARSAIRESRIHPGSHFLYAHSCKILLFYIMYEACQAAWSMVLYGRNVSESIPIWIYGIVMIWEYFTMVFVRSATSIYFFPRYIFILFVGYHFYFYGCTISPYPYANIALIPLFLLSVQGMIYVLLVCEIPSVQRGSISFECPREVFSRVAWSDWTAALPQDFTLFLPLNSRYRSLYDVNVLNQRQRQENEREEEEPDDNRSLSSSSSESENDLNGDNESTSESNNNAGNGLFAGWEDENDANAVVDPNTQRVLGIV